MRRIQMVFAVVALALVGCAGQALADGPSAGSSGEKVAQVHFVDRALNVVQLSDGTELRAPDQHMLTNLTVGEWVKVDYVSDGERVVLNSIAPARPDEIPGYTSAPATASGSTNRG
jgi:hypothetical protein